MSESFLENLSIPSLGTFTIKEKKVELVEILNQKRSLLFLQEK
jgi:hypothetical protein